MASSKMCESCIHHKVCLKDLNIVGEKFVPGNPIFFDNEELYKKYKDWEAKGFPCEDYISIKILEEANNVRRFRRPY